MNRSSSVGSVAKKGTPESYQEEQVTNGQVVEEAAQKTFQGDYECTKF